MGKRTSWRAKAMYLVFAVALVVGLMPLVAAPVAAQSPVTLEPCFDGTWANVWGADHVIYTVNLQPTDTFVGWALDSITPIGAASIVQHGGPDACGQRWCRVHPNTGNADIDATIRFDYVRGGNPANTTCLKEWHEDCEIELDTCGHTSEVIWNEAAKSLHGGPKVVKLTDLDCEGLLADGAVVHWFMVTTPTDCARITDSDDATVVGPVVSSVGAELTPVNPQQTDVFEEALDLLGVGPADDVWYVRTKTAHNDYIPFPDYTGCQMGHGTSWVQLETACEGPGVHQLVDPAADEGSPGEVGRPEDCPREVLRPSQPSGVLQPREPVRGSP